MVKLVKIILVLLPFFSFGCKGNNSDKHQETTITERLNKTTYQNQSNQKAEPEIEYKIKSAEDTLSKAILKFVPDEFTVHSVFEGNVNLDQFKDVILVLEQTNAESKSGEDEPAKRRFIILTGNGDQTYTLAAQNDNLIYYYGYDSNFLESFEELKIQEGKIVIEHYGGSVTRWRSTTSFEFSPDKKDWFLVKDEYSTFDATVSEPEEDTSLLSEQDYGKKSISEFSIY